MVLYRALVLGCAMRGRDYTSPAASNFTSVNLKEAMLGRVIRTTKKCPFYNNLKSFNQS
jgi:hypothetical protein